MNSPIEYYGGKSAMVHTLEKFFPQNYSIYVEGFGGGASVLLNKKRDEVEIYNDLNKNVYSLFKVISDKELMLKLRDKLSLTYYSSDLNREYKDKLKDDTISEFDRAYYFIYVNRTSFNGVGGFSVNPYVRRTMAKSISNYLSCIDGLEEIHERIFNAMIENRDIFELLDKYDDENTFFYLDPPYVQSTRKSSQKYDCEFEDEQHIKFVDRMLNMKGKVLISGYDHPIYDKLVENGWNKYCFEINYGCASATEVLWYNYNLNDGLTQLSLWD